MANIWYNLGIDALGLGQVNFLTDDLRVILLDTGLYTPDFDADQYVADIPPAAINPVRSGPLAGKSWSLGVFDAQDVFLAGVTGPSIEALGLIQWTGDDLTSRLLVYIDMANATLPVSPNGNAEIRWPDLGIFAFGSSCT